MNKELILSALNIELNQAFNIYDKDHKCVGKYVIININDRLELKYYHFKTSKWLKKSDSILGLLIISLINGDNYIKQLSESVIL